MHPIVYLLIEIIGLLNFVLFAWVILSLLIYFRIVNAYQPVVQKVNYMLNRLLDPLLQPIRRALPDLGGLDISPIILILILNFIKYTLLYYS